MSDRDECLPPSPDMSGASADVICTCSELERLRQERDRAIKDLEILQIGFGPRWIQTLKRQLALSREHYRQVLDRVQRNSAARIEHLRRQVVALTEAMNQQSASDARLWNRREDRLEKAELMESDLRKRLAEELTLRRRANARAEAAEARVQELEADATIARSDRALSGQADHELMARRQGMEGALRTIMRRYEFRQAGIALRTADELAREMYAEARQALMGKEKPV